MPTPLTIGTGRALLTPGAQWTPLNIPDLALWLDARQITGLADGAAVATWPDASGNGRDAAQGTAGNRPAYAAAGGTHALNGQPAVYWSGAAGKKLATPSFLGVGYDGAFTFFAVTRFDLYSVTRVHAADGGAAWSAGRTAAGVGAKDDIIQTTSGLTPSPSSTVLSARSNTINKACVETFRWDGATKTQRISGRQRAAVAATGTLGLSGALTIGDTAAGGSVWQGALAAYLIYNRALSDAECLRVERHLALAWKIDHVPQVLCHGNSLTWGTGSTAGNDFPAQLLALLGGANVAQVVNVGLPGQPTATMVSNAAEQIDSRRSGTTGRDTLVFWEGTNTLFFGATAATTTSAYASYLNQRNTAGWSSLKVVPTLLPRSDASLPAGFEANRQTVNTWIRANAATYNYAVADVAADSRIGDAGDEADTTYYSGDSVHLNDAGYAIVAGIIKAAIDTLP